MCVGKVAAMPLAVLLLFGATLHAADARFDPSGWNRYREIQIPQEVAYDVVGIPLESEVIEQCRPDMNDVRVVSSDGEEVAATIRSATAPVDVEPFPVRVFRMARRPRKWADLWVDKSAKVLTSGILIKTNAREFIRCVEIRGSDNARDEYVIRLDALIADLKRPVPLQSLEIRHPLNNFQYLHLRIHDDGESPIPVESVLCYPPAPEDPLAVPLSAHVMENRVHPDTQATILAADLGERRFPITQVSVDVQADRFVKQATLKCASSPSAENWRTIFEGTLYRLRKGDSVKELTTARFDPQPSRYLKLELSGADGVSITVRKISAVGSMPVVLFRHRRGEGYRLYYGNPNPAKRTARELPVAKNMSAVLASSAAIKLGDERKIEPRVEKAVTPAHPPKKERSDLKKPIGIAMLLAGLLLLFSLMLRSRSLRRKQHNRSSRILNVR